MAQAFVDQLTGEILGKISNFSFIEVDQITAEVLGYFQYGTVDVDLIVGEVIGEWSNASKQVWVDHLSAESLGQWAGF